MDAGEGEQLVEVAEALDVADLGDEHGGDRGTDARDGLQPAGGLAVQEPRDVPIGRLDLAFQEVELVEQEADLDAEVGDIGRFSDFDQLLAFAGVHPAERSSGRKGSNPETAWHMSKAGNSHLRAAAYRMAVVGVQHNPVIAAHYARKRAAGKSKMNALGHCMRKALSLVWGVWRNGQDFDPNWGVEA